MIDLLEMSVMEDALNVVLLFHSGGTWTEAHRAEWKRITGSDNIDAEALCEHVSKVLEYFQR